MNDIEDQVRRPVTLKKNHTRSKIYKEVTSIIDDEIWSRIKSQVGEDRICPSIWECVHDEVFNRVWMCAGITVRDQLITSSKGN